MSSERPSKSNRIRKVGGWFKGKSGLSRSPTPSPIGLESSPDDHMASTDTVSPPIPVPVSASIPAVVSQLGSVSIPGPLAENPPTVGVHVSLTIVIANDAHLAHVSEHP